MGGDGPAKPCDDRRPVVVAEAVEHRVEAVAALRQRQLQTGPTEDAAHGDLVSDAGGGADSIVPAVSRYRRRWDGIETRVVRIADRIPIPAVLIEFAGPGRSNAPAQVPSGTRPAAGGFLGPRGGWGTEDEDAPDDGCRRSKMHERRAEEPRLRSSSPPSRPQNRCFRFKVSANRPVSREWTPACHGLARLPARRLLGAWLRSRSSTGRARQMNCPQIERTMTDQDRTSPPVLREQLEGVHIRGLARL